MCLQGSPTPDPSGAPATWQPLLRCSGSRGLPSPTTGPLRQVWREQINKLPANCRTHGVSVQTIEKHVLVGGEPQSNRLWLQLLLVWQGFGQCNHPSVGATLSQETRVPVPASNANFLSFVSSQTSILASAVAGPAVPGLLLQQNDSERTTDHCFLTYRLSHGVSVPTTGLGTTLLSSYP